MNETQENGQSMKQYYIVGLVVLVAVVVAGYFLRPKATNMATTSPTSEEQQVGPTPTPGPITKLICDQEYYNQKIGFAEYYLSVEGGDVSQAAKVDCTFSVKIAGKEVATTQVSSPLTDKPQRAGSTFRCTTKAVAITPRTPAVVDIILKDDLGGSATCSAPFVFPAP